SDSPLYFASTGTRILGYTSFTPCSAANSLMVSSFRSERRGVASGGDFAARSVLRRAPQPRPPAPPRRARPPGGSRPGGARVLSENPPLLKHPTNPSLSTPPR